jgi:hypothetical protein
MRRARVVGLVVVLCISVVVLAAPKKHSHRATAKPEPPPAAGNFPLDKLTEFSATMVGGPLGNTDELSIYRSGDLMRTEMLDGNYMVTNLKTQDTFVVFPDRCIHDTRPSVNTFPFTAVHPGSKVERTALPNETIDGHDCQVENVVITPEQGLPLTLKLSEALDLNGFPLQVEIHRMTGTPVTIRYKDVKIGKPDAAVFQHPASCSQAVNPNGPANTKTQPKRKAEASKPSPATAPTVSEK